MGKNRTKRNRNSGTVSVCLIVIAFLVVMAVQIYRMKQKDEAYAAIEQERLEQLEDETQRAQELDELEAYMNSNEFIQEKANEMGLVHDNQILFKESEE